MTAAISSSIELPGTRSHRHIRSRADGGRVVAEVKGREVREATVDHPAGPRRDIAQVLDEARAVPDGARLERKLDLHVSHGRDVIGLYQQGLASCRDRLLPGVDQVQQGGTGFKAANRFPREDAGA